MLSVALAMMSVSPQVPARTGCGKRLDTNSFARGVPTLSYWRGSCVGVQPARIFAGSPGTANALSDLSIPAGHDVAFPGAGQRGGSGTERRALGPERLHATAQARGGLRSLCARGPDPPPPGIRHRQRDGGGT